ncbi:FtsP/CotA-like multicopper oxidase with cupredoxin domain [Pseudarthrobacter oxydans]|uniref:multicopper oxidase family protein n=1 Tax=Pseudarthrobacter oxydans TaxID=1671 RepID=UPI00278902C3|nr:multicopper oxidase family protein [Pseudarthrobacter oxydans]MDP9981125.1 FtsP/CotA-like multicopper oxidase with cupredoxin domain [Pseudarthrobacter oxydans]
MRPISRRDALIAGGLGTAATVAGAAGLWWSLTSAREPAGVGGVVGGAAPVQGAELRGPAELRSTDGRLELTLGAAPGRVELGGRQARALCYNGTVPGPTLRLRPGDELNVRLENGLNEPTNLHVHGLHVSPQTDGDNVFRAVLPGQGFDYRYRLPPDHPPGVYWYHPHHHGMVADQIFAGLFGAIIVEDPDAIPVSTERVLLVSDTTLDSAGNIAAVSPMERMAGREGELLLLNGQSNPVLTAQPGARERWRIINTCVARYLRLRLDGQQLQLLGMDSGRSPEPETVDELLLAPGNRADLLVTATAGEAVLQALPYDRGAMPGMMMMGQGPFPVSGAGALATFRVSGASATPPGAVTSRTAQEDLRTAAVAARRQVVLSMGAGQGMRGGGMAGMMRFTINGREYSDARTDTTVAAGTVEEWTLVNTSPMDHPFHLHVWPMQLINDNGRAAGPVVMRDVVNVRANGRATVRIAFRDFSGRSVYHCHILDHEDLGMMSVIEVR